MISFIHTADIHFGMENYGKIDPLTGIHTRLLDFHDALNSCIDIAVAKEVDFFLFCGDAYKTAHPTPTQQKLLLGCFLRLYKAGIPVVIIVGNHDNPLSFGKATSLELFHDMPLDGFHVIDKPKILFLETKHGPVQIAGIPWPTRNTIALNKEHMHSDPEVITSYISQAVAKIIQTFAQEVDQTIPTVLASHMTVGSGVFSGSEKRAIYGNDPVLMPSQLALPAFDYVALGHLHRYQNLNPTGYPAIVYAGSIDRIDFGERKEPKGFCYVQLERHATTHTFIEVPTRPFIQIEVYLEEEQDQTEQIIAAIKAEKISQAIIKILYHVPIGHKDHVDIQAIERATVKAHYVVGIIPIYTPTTKTKRSFLKAQMNLESLLLNYFDEKAETQKNKAALTQKALDLYQSCTSCEDEAA